VSEKWEFSDVENEFYIYLQKTAGNDVLDPLRSLQLTDPQCDKQKTACLENLKLIFESLTIPFFLLQIGSSQCLHTLVKKLQEKAADGCDLSLAVATHLFNEKYYLAAVESISPTFQLIHEKSFVKPQLQTLYKLGMSRFYGCLEEASKELLKILICEDLTRLDTLDSIGKRIGRSNCTTLKNRITSDQQQYNLMLSEAYDENILNKGYQIEQYTELFECLSGFQRAASDFSSLKTLESGRHLVIHRSSVIDVKYLSEVSSLQSVGDKLLVSAQDIYGWQNSLVSYFTDLIRYVDAEVS